MNKSLIIAALAAVSVDAATRHAKQRVAGTKKHLEKVYGKGLVGLFDEEGNMTYRRMRAARTRPAFNTMLVNGLGAINADSASAWFYGTANGLQYKGMAAGARDSIEDSIQSDCFYAVYGMVDTVDLQMHDFSNIMADGSFNWFNVAGYNPLHIMGDSSVSYQYCGGNNQLTNLTSTFSADYAFIS